MTTFDAKQRSCPKKLSCNLIRAFLTSVVDPLSVEDRDPVYLDLIASSMSQLRISKIYGVKILLQ